MDDPLDMLFRFAMLHPLPCVVMLGMVLTFVAAIVCIANR